VALLSQLLGNRDLAWEDSLEKGRIWVYQEGNEYTKFCNQFCWNAPATGRVIIEAWGASGSGARSCCCAFNVPGNPGAYVKKCICVIAGNKVCGCLGFSCGNSGDQNYRGRSEPTNICWTGCAPHALFNSNRNPCNLDNIDSWKGINPFGLGGSYQMGSTVECFSLGVCGGAVSVANGQASICCAAGATAGCLCAQGGRGGLTYCTTGESPYACGVGAIRLCGHSWGAVDMCSTGPSSCGMLCNIYNSRCRYFNWEWASAFGGDLNCCGTFSCKSHHNCVNNCHCAQQHHLTTAPGKYSTEGAVISFSSNQDSPMARASGSPGVTALLAIQSATPWPSWGFSAICNCAYAGCGCYEDMGCHRNMPSGVPGAGGGYCGDVRDGGYAGGHGSVRIKFIPDAGQNAY
jgi:hypothetical protein